MATRGTVPVFGEGTRYVSDSDASDGHVPESDGRPLRAVRVEPLLTIRELAELANVAPSTIYLIEAGRSVPQLSVVRRLAEALDVDPTTVAEFRRAIRIHSSRR